MAFGFTTLGAGKGGSGGGKVSAPSYARQYGGDGGGYGFQTLDMAKVVKQNDDEERRRRQAEAQKLFNSFALTQKPVEDKRTPAEKAGRKDSPEANKFVESLKKRPDPIRQSIRDTFKVEAPGEEPRATDRDRDANRIPDNIQRPENAQSDLLAKIKPEEVYKVEEALVNGDTEYLSKLRDELFSRANPSNVQKGKDLGKSLLEGVAAVPEKLDDSVRAITGWGDLEDRSRFIEEQRKARNEGISQRLESGELSEEEANRLKQASLQQAILESEDAAADTEWAGMDGNRIRIATGVALEGAADTAGLLTTGGAYNIAKTGGKAVAKSILKQSGKGAVEGAFSGLGDAMQGQEFTAQEALEKGATRAALVAGAAGGFGVLGTGVRSVRNLSTKSGSGLPNPRKVGQAKVDADGTVDPVAYAKQQAKARNRSTRDSFFGKDPQNISFTEKVGNKFLDRNAKLKKVVRQLAKGMDEEEGADLISKFDEATGSVYRANALGEEWLNNQGFRKVLQALPDNDTYEAFSEYLLAKQRQFRRASGEVTEGFKKGAKQDQRIIDELGENFEPLAQEYYKIRRALLEYAADPDSLNLEKGAGRIIDKDMAEQLIKDNPEYVSLEKVIEGIDEATGFGGNTGSISSQGLVRKFKGVAGTEKDPFLSLQEAAHRVHRQVKVNEVATLTKNLMDIEGNPLGIKMLRKHENVLRRMEIRKELKQSRKTKSLLTREIKKNGTAMKAVQEHLGVLEQRFKGKISKKQSQIIREIIKETNSIDIKPNATQAKTVQNFKNFMSKNKDNVDGRTTEMVPVQELSKYMEFDRGANPIGKKRYQELKADIEKNGIKEPLIITYGAKDRIAALGEGNHRLAIARELGMTDVPVQVTGTQLTKASQKADGKGFGKVKGREPDQFGYVPSNQKPSDIGIKTSPNRPTRVTPRLPVNGSKLAKQPTLDEAAAIFEKWVLSDKSGLRGTVNLLAKRNKQFKELQSTFVKLEKEMSTLNAGRKDKWLESKKLADDASANKHTISRLEGNTKEILEVPEWLEKTMKANTKNPEYVSGILRGINAVYRMRKAGITGTSPGFILRNVPRDMQTQVTTSPRGFKHLKPNEFVKAYWDSILNTDASKLAKQHGGIGVLVDTIRPSSRSTKAVRRSGTKLGKITTVVTNPGDAFRRLEDVLNITETAGRQKAWNIAMKDATKKFPNDPQKALREATIAARNDSIDFFVKGEYGDLIKAWGLYLNPSIQGTRKIGKAMRDEPVKTTAKYTAMMAGPATASVVWNMSDEKRARIYDEIQDYEKEKNFVIIGPNAAWNEEKKMWDGVWKIPKVPGLSAVANAFEDIARGWMEQGKAPEVKTMLAELGMGVLETGKVEDNLDSAVTPDIAEPFFQQKDNKVYFTGNEIVPEDAGFAESKRGYASNLSKGIGDVTGIDPLRTDQFMKDMFGSTGQGVLNTAESALGFEDPGGRSFKDQIEGSFYGSYGGAVDKKFWEIRDKMKSYKDVQSDKITAEVKAGNINKAQRLAKELNDKIEEAFDPWFEKYGTEQFGTDRDYTKPVDYLKVSEDIKYIKRRGN